MTYDEFADKLREIKSEFRTKHGRDVRTVEELEEFLVYRKYRFGKKNFLRSLKGTGL